MSKFPGSNVLELNQATVYQVFEQFLTKSLGEPVKVTKVSQKASEYIFSVTFQPKDNIAGDNDDDIL